MRGRIVKPKLTEEQKWNQFEEHRAKRRMKHDHNLPEDCEGCRAKMYWKTIELVALIKALRSPGNKLEVVDLCRELQRPVNGIISKMRRVGLVHFDPSTPYTHHVSRLIYKKRFEELAEEVREALIEEGWHKSGYHYAAPEWWANTRIINNVWRDNQRAKNRGV